VPPKREEKVRKSKKKDLQRKRGKEAQPVGGEQVIQSPTRYLVNKQERTRSESAITWCPGEIFAEEERSRGWRSRKERNSE